MSNESLMRLYESPSTPLNSGSERAERQASILAGITSTAERQLIGVDIGCGDGQCTRTMQTVCDGTSNASVGIVGVDWSMAALRQARGRNVPVARASADAGGLPIATSSVDFVIMSELIEHLVDPDSTLDEARRILIPGGTLLLSTPNLAAWFNRVLLPCGIQPVFTEVSLRGIYGRPGSEVVGHLRIFTRRALEGLLKANGFIEVDISGAPGKVVPRPLKPLDRLMCRTPSLASSLFASARLPT